MTHHLKVIPPYFEHIWHRWKTFEVRINDRDFYVNDTVILQEYIPPSSFSAEGKYTGRSIKARIKYILDDVDGLKDGYCVFSLTDFHNITERFVNTNDEQ